MYNMLLLDFKNLIYSNNYSYISNSIHKIQINEEYAKNLLKSDPDWLTFASFIFDNQQVIETHKEFLRNDKKIFD